MDEWMYQFAYEDLITHDLTEEIKIAYIQRNIPMINFAQQLPINIKTCE